MMQIILFIILTALSIMGLLWFIFRAIINIIAKIKDKPNFKNISRLRKALAFLICTLLINVCLITFSQLMSSTPAIIDENGNTIKNSIAEIRALKLNGRKQWVSIRGWDRSKPVLLFLAGGPGGSQMVAVRNELKELEKHFVVVNWDQPGSGKSYYAHKIKNITVETYIDDGYALTEYLKERFSQEKIYLIGESWGSALGIFLIDKYPESYHAFIGTGQMVDFLETEKIDYYKAIEIAKGKGNIKLVDKLKANGEPPYYGSDMVWKSSLYLNYLTEYMSKLSNVHNPGYNTLRDICGNEYGLLDRINFFRGIVLTFNNVYQQLYHIDLREDYTKLDVPVYFFLGRYDFNAPTSLVEEYESVLEAPEKKIVWFEHSAHSPWINESEKFVKEVLTCFLGD